VAVVRVNMRGGTRERQSPGSLQGGVPKESNGGKRVSSRGQTGYHVCKGKGSCGKESSRAEAEKRTGFFIGPGPTLLLPGKKALSPTSKRRMPLPLREGKGNLTREKN